MKKISFLILLCLTTSLFNVFSQTKSIDSVYSNYFEKTREILFLHLNKTSFLKGEEVWIQAYVIEQNTNKLHPTTSNLYVSIFEENGSLKDQHLVKVINGVGRSNFLIDSTYTNDRYFLKTSTNWMKNFNEDHSFNQEIKIISSELKPLNTVINEDDNYEFQLFPEGGHILANTKNNIGILVKDSNNKGVKITKGIIKSIEGDVVGEFTTNDLGFGAKEVFVTQNEVLTFEATLENDFVVKTTTEIPKATGITIHAKNRNDRFFIDILTNAESLKQLENKKYSILVHNTRKFKNHYFSFDDKTTTLSLALNKNELFNGINIITVFNEKNIPVLERLIFNNFNYSFDNKLNISYKNFKTDSSIIKFRNTLNEKIKLSASFLPLRTKAYNPKNNIKSTLLLKPYVKGFIEKPESYFYNESGIKNLDFLLLTQGWSKYNWDDVFNKPPTTAYSFENGIDVSLKINQKIRKNQFVLVYSIENELIRTIPAKKDTLTLKNSFIKKNSTIDFALRFNNNLYKILPVLKYSKNSLDEFIDITQFPKLKNVELEVNNFENLTSEVEVLDEITLKTKKIKYETKAYGAETMLTGFKMENMIITPGELVLNFLALKRFDVQLIDNNVFIGKRGAGNRRRDPEAGSNLLLRQMRNVRVYLDGSEITASLWMIDNMFLNTVKEIRFGRDPGQFAEVIYIDTLSPSEYASKTAEYTKVKVPIGFASSKEYYSPKYPSYVEDSFINFGAIYWKSNITIEPNAEIEFSFPKRGKDNFRIFTEGISESGKLISINKILD